ncbi:MAG TPA: NACHT domain-containing protein [Actinomycetes bacterium]|nr:NACHT domain-containing protein [Actinomycetes bacterium]
MTDYTHQVHDRYQYIIPPHLDDKRQVPIKDLYISPLFSTSDARFDPISNRAARDAITLSFDRVLRRLYRTVVLGDPGAGKSTLAQKLAYDFSEPDGKHYETPGQLCVPFLITLRNYALYRRRENASVLQFIESHVNAEFQVQAPPGAIEYLLVSGRALVIFDGLDELLETHRRRDITNVVESFARQYPYSSILVTSRKVGYPEAPLNPDIFGVVYLAHLEESSIVEYVKKWFSLDTTLSVAEREELVASFLSESASVQDLRSNPLMLGLLCNVYRGVRSIPRNRAELYEKCALMLFERWDSMRGISAPGALKADAKYALQHLALWMYSDESLANGVLHRRVVEEVGKHMLKIRFEDPDRAKDAAQKLVALWRGRAWVLTDTGSAGSGEPLYQFTHRTFLEYFAAAQLVRTHPAPSALWKILSPRLRRREWEVVAQLSIQIMNYGRDGAVDDMFTQLLRSVEAGTIVDRVHLLGFAARYLDTLAPTPKICRQVARACLNLFLEGHPTWKRMPNYEHYLSTVEDYLGQNDEFEIQVEELLLPLVTIMALQDDMGTFVNDEVVQYTKILANQSLKAASKAVVFALNLAALRRATSGHARNEQDEALDDLIGYVQGLVPKLARLDFWVGLSAARLGLITVSQLVAWQGLGPLFCRTRTYPYLHRGPGRVPALAESIVKKLIAAQPEDLSRLSPQDVADLHAIAEAFRIRFAEGTKRPGDGLDPAWLDIDFAKESDLFHYVLRLTESSSKSVEAIEEPLLEDWGVEDGENMVDQEFDSSVDESSWDMVWEPLEMPQRTRRRYERGTPIDSEILFCGAALLAVFVELEEWIYDPDEDERATRDESTSRSSLALGCLQELEPILLARSVRHLYSQANVALGESNLREGDRKILGMWSRRQLSFGLERAAEMKSSAS